MPRVIGYIHALDATERYKRTSADVIPFGVACSSHSATIQSSAGPVASETLRSCAMVEAPIVDRMREHGAHLNQCHGPCYFRIDTEPAPETPGAVVHSERESVDMVFVDDLPGFHNVTFTSYSEPD